MKKLIIAVLCFTLLNKIKAQTADRVELDKIYQHINKTLIPTGYLNDYGSAVINKVRYNGLITDSNFVPNMNVFRLTLNDLLSAKINPTATNHNLFVIARNEAISQNNRKIASSRNLRNDAQELIISSQKNTTL